MGYCPVNVWPFTTKINGYVFVESTVESSCNLVLVTSRLFSVPSAMAHPSPRNHMLK